LVVLEPAFEALRRAHDTTVHGRRRYRRAQLESLVERRGFEIVRATYAYSFLVPAAAVLAAVDRLRPNAPAGPASDVEGRGLDALSAPLARVERRFLARHSLPVGTSALVVAQRR